MINDQSTIQEGKMHINSSLLYQQKVQCPCCEHLIGRYKRRITKGMIYFLIALYQDYMGNKAKRQDSFVFYKTIQDRVFKETKRNVTDFVKLKAWGLIIPKAEYNEGTGLSSGYWSITQRGIAFLSGRLSVSKILYQDDRGNTISESADKVTINDYFKEFKFQDIKW